MTTEAFTLLLKISKWTLYRNKWNPDNLRKKELLFGWGVPAIVVGIAAGVGLYFDSYVDGNKRCGYTLCWLNRSSLLYYLTVILPFIVIYVINSTILIIVLRFVFKMSVKSRKRTLTNEKETNKNLPHIKATLKSFEMLFVVLGIPYIFGFLSGEQLCAGLFMKRRSA